jgi:hypothetical protein
LALVILSNNLPCWDAPSFVCTGRSCSPTRGEPVALLPGKQVEAGDSMPSAVVRGLNVGLGNTVHMG